MSSQLQDVHRRRREYSLNEHVLAPSPLSPMHSVTHLRVSDHQFDELFSLAQSLASTRRLEMFGDRIKQFVVERS